MRPGSFALRPLLAMLFGAGAFLLLVSFATMTTHWDHNVNYTACTMEAKICPDGTAVGRHGPTCAFDPCPTANTNTSANINSSSNANISANTNSVTATPVSTVPGKAAFIYYIQKQSIIDHATGLDWPTYDIFEIVDNGAPALLATVGNVNESPRNYYISPDRKMLALDLQVRAIVVDLATKKTIFTYVPKRDVAGLAFSQDSSKLFIWDQKDGDSDKSYTAHSINLATLSDTIVGKGSTDQAYSADTWRSDGDVILMHYYYPTGSIHVYHPTTNKITQTEDVTSLMSLISSTGKLYSLVVSTNDPCNEYSGSASSVYTVKDTKTGEVKGTFGDSKFANQLVTYSPDDNEVLFSSQVIPADYAHCIVARPLTYYRQKLGGQPVAVNNPNEVLQEWHANRVVYTTEHVGDANSSDTKILVDGKAWQVPFNATIIQTFYTK